MVGIHTGSGSLTSGFSSFVSLPAETERKTSIPNHFWKGRYEMGLGQLFYKVHKSYQKIAIVHITPERMTSRYLCV